jgi:hypothetical protein
MYLEKSHVKLIDVAFFVEKLIKYQEKTTYTFGTSVNLVGRSILKIDTPLYLTEKCGLWVRYFDKIRHIFECPTIFPKVP